MTKQHPITPPPELVQQWCLLPLSEEEILVISAQWGADQAFEAFLKDLSILWDKEEIVTLDDLLKHLRAARRPKPPSLKELALARLEKVEQLIASLESAGLVPFHEKDDSIREALEALPDA